MVSIIILARNQWDYTRMCLESIKAFTRTPHEVIVIDNGSTDGTAAKAKALGAHKVILNRENLGFPAGCNQGLLAAEPGSHPLLLNNDIIVTDGWLDRLVAHLDANPNLGAIGPVSNNAAGFQRIDVPFTHIDYLAPFARDIGERFSGVLETVPRLIGLCLLVRSEAMTEVGGLDTVFGIGNFEDDDLCIRVASCGYELAVARDVFIHHFGSTTFASERINLVDLHKENWRIFCRKWGLPEETPLWHFSPADLAADTSFPQNRYIDPAEAVNNALVARGLSPNSSGIVVTADNLADFAAISFDGTGRNDLCPCGSGKKFKKCHGSS